MASKYQRVASTVLYSGAPPASGKRFGSMPRSATDAKESRIARAVSGLPVESVRPPIREPVIARNDGAAPAPLHQKLVGRALQAARLTAGDLSPAHRLGRLH